MSAGGGEKWQSRPVTRQQAIGALRQQVSALVHCQPDTALARCPQQRSSGRHVGRPPTISVSTTQGGGSVYRGPWPVRWRWMRSPCRRVRCCRGCDL
ncbi:DUF6233 domain-containing protein [Streptomyces pharetrae]